METMMKALVWTFVHSLWQGLLAALIAAVIITTTKRTRAQIRYNLLGLLFIAFLIGSVVTFFVQWGLAMEARDASLIQDSAALVGSLEIQQGLANILSGWFDQNALYGIASYSKGCVFLAQLGYVIGQEKLAETIKRFYADYKFTHPTPNDIKRTAEKVTGAHLDWYLIDFAQTTNTIDYKIKEVKEEGGKTNVTLERIGRMPMPIDIIVAYDDNSQESFYIPLEMMRYEKSNPYPNLKRTVLPDWDWGHKTYEFTINKPKAAIKVMAIDPTELMADVNKDDNIYVAAP